MIGNLNIMNIAGIDENGIAIQARTGIHHRVTFIRNINAGTQDQGIGSDKKRIAAHRDRDISQGSLQVLEINFLSHSALYNEKQIPIRGSGSSRKFRDALAE